MGVQIPDSKRDTHSGILLTVFFIHAGFLCCINTNQNILNAELYNWEIFKFSIHVPSLASYRGEMLWPHKPQRPHLFTCKKIEILSAEWTFSKCPLPTPFARLDAVQMYRNKSHS